MKVFQQLIKRFLRFGAGDSLIRHLSSVGAKGAESGDKERQTWHPFHSDVQFLRSDRGRNVFICEALPRGWAFHVLLLIEPVK
jgi:hypothetical protein